MSFQQTILVLFFSAGMFELPVKEKWVVEKDGYLRIEGSTNVNKFSCSIEDYAAPDTITLFLSVDRSIPMTGCISLPVSSIDCLNRIMNNDLRKTLKAKEHPALNIHFLSLSQYPCLKGTVQRVSGMVYIELAGASKKYEINYRVWQDERQVIHLVGDQRIRFSDFGLAPPRRVGGVVKANDVLDVEFHVNCKVVRKDAK